MVMDATPSDARNAKPERGRRTLFWTAACTYALIVLLFAQSLGRGSAEHPIGMALCLAPITAFVAFSIALIVACCTRRALVRADFIRVILWALIGAGFGVVMMADGYYRRFHPDLAPRFVAGGYVLMTLCAVLIALVTIMQRRRGVHPGHGCPTCSCDSPSATVETPARDRECPPADGHGDAFR